MVLEILSRIIAIFMFVLLLPIYAVTIICCLIFQGLPIFYKQGRIGYKFKKFNIYKFRTMVINSGKVLTVPDDKRITKFGRILRYTKIDELPQIINIIKGDMRFIGPRPEVEEYFSKKNFKFLKIVKPGISDYASIILRDESRILKKIGGNDSYQKLLPVKLELANYYSEKKSFLLDLKLVGITVISIFFPDYAVKKLALPGINLKSDKFKTFLINFVFG